MSERTHTDAFRRKRPGPDGRCRREGDHRPARGRDRPGRHAAGNDRADPDDRVKKGDLLAVAQVAGIMAAKRTHELVPMCHPLLLTEVALELELDEARRSIRRTVETRGQTGVEMEALTAVSVAALTVYDMVKAVDRGMTISGIGLAEKSGGKSGEWVRA